MKQWHEIPAVFKRNMALSCAVAIGSLLVTVAVFFVTGDRVLLHLGLVLFLLGIIKSSILIRTILTGSYETVLGVCSGIDQSLLSQNSRVHITLPSGVTLTLPMNCGNRFEKERAYLLYFKKGTSLDEGSGMWTQRAQADSLLAYEETDLVNCEEIQCV